MRINKDNFLIRIDDSVERSRIMSSDGKPLAIDLDFNPKEHKKQVGIIIALPIRMSAEYNSTIEVGDKVLVSHQVADADHLVEGDIYRCEYFNIFAKINNELEPIEDFVFCDKVLEDKESVLVMRDSLSTKYAKVISVSKKAKEYGVMIGDRIYFTHNADYPLIVGDKEYTRMRLRNVIGIERDGQLLPAKNKILVEEIIEKKFVAGIEVMPEPTPQKTGNVLSGKYLGEKICYYNGHNSVLDWKGKRYSFLIEDNIKFIYES